MIGAVTAIRLDPPGLDLSSGAFLVADPSLLGGLRVGDHVTVTWEEEGSTRRAVRIAPRAYVTLLDAVEQQDLAGLKVKRAHAARVRAEELMDVVRQVQRTCPTCGLSLATSRGVLFQGDHLVHAACWRADPKPFDDPPPAGKRA
jgi:hypothetical protein